MIKATLPCRVRRTSAWLLMVLASTSTVQADSMYLNGSRQFGTGLLDCGTSVATDRHGDIYLTGFSRGSVFGPRRGSNDILLAKYNADGSRI